MTKEEFESKAHQAIDDISRRIEELSIQAEKLGGELRDEVEERIQNLRQEKESFRTKMNDFNQDADTTWDDAKIDFAEALEHMKTGFKKLGRLFD